MRTVSTALIIVLLKTSQLVGKEPFKWDIQPFLKMVSPITSRVDPFDGPQSLSAKATTTQTKTPTKKEILFYAKQAGAFYCGDHKTTSPCSTWNQTATFTKEIQNPVANTKSIVSLFPKRKEIVVAFRGTEGAQDGILDLKVIAMPITGVQKDISVHVGFYIAVQSIYDEIVDTVKAQLSLNPEVNHIGITGGSLGGAMSSVTMFLFNYFSVFGKEMKYTLITFGQPRVGNVGFVNYMNNLSITMARIVARADIVPHVPTVSVVGAPLLGSHYLHHMQEVWINDNDEMIFCSKEQYEDPLCSHTYSPSYSATDHGYYFEYFAKLYEIEEDNKAD